MAGFEIHCDEIDDLKAEIINLNEEIDDLKAEIRNLNEEIELLTDSKNENLKCSNGHLEIFFPKEYLECPICKSSSRKDLKERDED